VAGTGSSPSGPRESAGGLACFRSPEDFPMNALLPLADTLPATPLAAPGDTAAAVHAAALLILPHLERGARVDAVALRGAMETAFGGSDATGLWDWKTAYEACEVATVLFLRKYGKALFRKAGSPVAALPLLGKIVGLLPTHTRRSQESQALQQFSTPIPLGLVAATAAAITPADRVLEPSAGTGLLAILAEIAGGSLVLNELADTRAALLSSLFPAIPSPASTRPRSTIISIAAAVPSVVLMNPPFSAMVHVEGRVADAAFRHVASALARLAPGGRLVTITGANFGPEAPAWTAAFARLQERGRVVFSAGDRRRGLCQAWHDLRHAAHRHRQAARRRSHGLPGLAGHRAGRRDAHGLDRRASSAAPAGRSVRHRSGRCACRRAQRARLSQPRRQDRARRTYGRA
jgi:predicted RNA methylase